MLFVQHEVNSLIPLPFFSVFKINNYRRSFSSHRKCSYFSPSLFTCVFCIKLLIRPLLLWIYQIFFLLYCSNAAISKVMYLCVFPAPFAHILSFLKDAITATAFVQVSFFPPKTLLVQCFSIYAVVICQMESLQSYRCYYFHVILVPNRKCSY